MRCIAMISIVYNSPQYAIVAYPAQQGIRAGRQGGSRSLFVQGSVARRVAPAIESIPD
jgi:hypothetical protein